MFSKIKVFINSHRRLIILWLGVVVVAIIFAVLAALFIYNTTPHYTYKPINACDILSDADAGKYISGQYVNNTTTPEVTGNTATSKCSYTDLQKDATKTTVLALAIQSAINEKGTKQLKSDFESTKAASTDIESISGVGDEAFFTKTSGQLHVLSDRSWLIVSYGYGQSPQDNNITKSVEIAKLAIANIPHK